MLPTNSTTAVTRHEAPTRWVLTAVACALAAGCDDRPGRLRPGSAAAYIAVVGASEDDPLWPVLRSGAKRFERDLSRYPVRYLAPKVATAAAQQDVLRSLMDGPLRGLCIHPVEPSAIEPLLKEMRASGIEIVTMIHPVSRDVRVAHVGLDDDELGRWLARATAQALHSRGHIMVLHSGYEDPRFGRRYTAFTKELRRFPQIEVWAEIDCHSSPDEARAAMKDRASRFDVSAWVSMAPWAIDGISVTSSELPPGSRIITVGALPPQWEWISEGICSPMVGVHYRDMGYRALALCHAAVVEEAPQLRDYFADLRMVWTSNLEAYRQDWNEWTTQRDPEREAAGVLAGRSPTIRAIETQPSGRRAATPVSP